MGSKAKKPSDRSYYGELSSTLSAQKKIAPEMLSAMSQYNPQFTAQNVADLKGSITGNLQTAQEVAPQYQEQDEALNQQAIANNPLLAGMQRTAIEDLARGGDLTTEEQLAANEEANSSYAGTGMLGSNQSLLNRILNRSTYSNNRKQQALSNAQSVYGTTSQAGTGRSLLSGLVDNASSTVGNTWINPESSYAQDVYNTNYNAAQSNYNAAKNRKSALIGSLIGGTAKIASGGFL